MDCVPPKKFMENARNKFTCQECGPVVFEKFSDVEQRRTALENKFDRIICVGCRRPPKIERPQEITCRQKPKPLSDFPETVDEIVARTHKSIADASSKMLCQSYTYTIFEFSRKGARAYSITFVEDGMEVTTASKDKPGWSNGYGQEYPLQVMSALVYER